MALFSDVLLTVDYDRTLTAPDSTIPERNLEAIRYFMDNGGTFTVNTGRSIPMTKVFRDRVPVNAPLLLYNGSAAFDMAKGEFAFLHEIQMDLWDTIRKCEEWFPGLTVEVQGIKAHYRFRENPAWDAFCDNNQCARDFARPGDDLGPFLKFSIYGKLWTNTVADLFGGTAEEIREIDRVVSVLKERFGEYCEVFRTAPRIIDVHAKGVSKGRSARELKQQLGKKILVCVGDAENDLPMLHDADYAYCPSDGVVADQFENVCKCGDGSVAAVIYEKIPEILKKALTE